MFLLHVDDACIQIGAVTQHARFVQGRTKLLEHGRDVRRAELAERGIAPAASLRTCNQVHKSGDLSVHGASFKRLNRVKDFSEIF
ncbi:cytochrome c1 [Rhodoblastus acidophilus]|uniref:hypothetical protein n=1 Tax=Rhodoblastus acidophilus TaxID=1074 RepID=UPI0022253673|nr:hypothetical protein [Rhodoblastus acidophilus]MCW2318914.1 cytochrome c1 [Rhodoblastus acidophilus]